MMNKFAIGDHVEMANPYFPEKRPTRHKVTALVDGAGEHADKTMLMLDGVIGAAPEWCRKARLVYPSQDLAAMGPLSIAIAALVDAETTARAKRKSSSAIANAIEVLRAMLSDAQAANKADGPS